MSFIEEITKEAYTNEYWKKLVDKIKSEIPLTEKEFDDTKRFIDLLTLSRHKEANKEAYEIMLKLEDNINYKTCYQMLVFTTNIKASLARYEEYNFEFTKEELDVMFNERRNYLKI